MGVAGIISVWAEVDARPLPGEITFHENSQVLQLIFAPGPAVAQSSLSNIHYNGADGEVGCGITEFTNRPDPNGPDSPPIIVGQQFPGGLGEFGSGQNFSVTDPAMSSVTALLYAGEDQWVRGGLTVWIFD